MQLVVVTVPEPLAFSTIWRLQIAVPGQVELDKTLFDETQSPANEFTIMGSCPLMLFTVSLTVIIAVPAATVVTSPELLTVATVGLIEDQV